MRKFIVAALMTATILPSAAMAQNGELRRDRQDVRQEQRELNRAYRSGDPRRIQEERRDVREARQELREDRRDVRRDNWGRDDWRSYRNTNRNIYSRGNWNANFRYQTFNRGGRIANSYYAPRYYINDYARYRLPRPGFNQRWVRHYNDVLLVDVRGGRVVDVIRNFYL